MSRNLRNRNHPAPNPASSYEIAPDFFNIEDSYDEMAEYVADRLRDWRNAHPYKPGMVVWMECRKRDGSKITKRAYITDVFSERDRYGDRRAKYRVHVETAKGDRFAKNFVYTWPGYIERGYRLANEAKK